MANANITKLGVTDAVEKERAAVEAAAPTAPEAPVAPNVSERRVVGRYEFKTPQGQIIVVENL